MKFAVVLLILFACAKSQPTSVTDFDPPAYSYTDSSGGSSIILPDAGVAWLQSPDGGGVFDIKGIACNTKDVVKGFARLTPSACAFPSGDKFEAHELDGGHSVWLGCDDDAGNPVPPYDEILSGFFCILIQRPPP